MPPWAHYLTAPPRAAAAPLATAGSARVRRSPPAASPKRTAPAPAGGLDVGAAMGLAHSLQVTASLPVSPTASLAACLSHGISYWVSLTVSLSLR